jgi:hypothetical protein
MAFAEHLLRSPLDGGDVDTDVWQPPAPWLYLASHDEELRQLERIEPVSP